MTMEIFIHELQLQTVSSPCALFFKQKIDSLDE